MQYDRRVGYGHQWGKYPVSTVQYSRQPLKVNQSLPQEDKAIPLGRWWWLIYFAKLIDLESLRRHTSRCVYEEESPMSWAEWWREKWESWVSSSIFLSLLIYPDESKTPHTLATRAESCSNTMPSLLHQVGLCSLNHEPEQAPPPFIAKYCQGFGHKSEKGN